MLKRWGTKREVPSQAKAINTSSLGEDDVALAMLGRFKSCVLKVGRVIDLVSWCFLGEGRGEDLIGFSLSSGMVGLKGRGNQ